MVDQNLGLEPMTKGLAATARAPADESSASGGGLGDGGGDGGGAVGGGGSNGGWEGGACVTRAVTCGWYSKTLLPAAAAQRAYSPP